MIFRSLLCTVLAMSTCAALAGSVNVDFNEDVVRFGVGWPVLGERAGMEAAWLHHQERGDIASAALHVAGKASSGAGPLEGGVGGKLVFVDADDADGYVLGIGAFLRYSLPAHDRVGFGGSLYFAPDVLAAGDTDGYREIGLHAGYDVVDNGQIYLGYRYAKAGFDNRPDVTFDTGLHFGLRLEF